MMAHCRRHGPRRQFVFVSPDIGSEIEVDATQVILVDLIQGSRVEHVVTISRDFAQQHGIVEQTLDYLDTFVNAQWFHQLTSMCCECYGERWPQRLEEMKRRNR